MHAESLTIHDVAHCVLSGAIIGRQPDNVAGEWMPSMICEIRGQGGARIRRVTRSHGQGADLLVIENVPIVSCPSCGESYLTAETLRTIDAIIRDRRRVAVERPVEVATFS